MKKNLLVLICIVLLATVLRVYNLGQTPAINADEAALGYNAYSLIKTGLDEHGNPFPLNFQSFNDYKPGLTVYLIMPVVYFFGLNEWSVRILPALLGAFSVVVTYLVAKLLVESEGKGYKEAFPLLSALFLAISPWHIHFSRGAWEVNVATLFILVGIYSFLKFTRRSWFLPISALFFALSLYTYHSARILVPVIVLFLAVIYSQEVLKKAKVVLASAIFAFVLCVPLVMSILGPAGLARAGGVGLWSDIGPQNRINELRGEHSTNTLGPRILHNKLVIYSIAFLDNWLTHYSGEFLFVSGDDIQRNKVPGLGQLYSYQIIFIVFGIFTLFKSSNREWKVILFWLLVAPIPAALTFQSPHALRSENMIIPITLLTAFGVVSLFGLIKKNHHKYLLGSIFTAVVLLCLGRYLFVYHNRMAREYPFSSQYGLAQLFESVANTHKGYKDVIVTDRYDQPYIMFLFYGVKAGLTEYEPEVFQRDHTLSERDEFGFSTVKSFSNFKFETIKLDEAKKKYPDSLIIGTEEEIPNSNPVIGEVFGTNGYKYFRILKN